MYFSYIRTQTPKGTSNSFCPLPNFLDSIQRNLFPIFHTLANDTIIHMVSQVRSLHGFHLLLYTTPPPPANHRASSVSLVSCDSVSCCPPHSSLLLLTHHICLLKYLLCVKHCATYWEYTVNKIDMISPLMELIL